MVRRVAVTVRRMVRVRGMRAILVKVRGVRTKRERVRRERVRREGAMRMMVQVERARGKRVRRGGGDEDDGVGESSSKGTGGQSVSMDLNLPLSNM